MAHDKNPARTTPLNEGAKEQNKHMMWATDVFRDFVSPVFRRPDYLQAAALCLREASTGREVLLITSLTTHRWILPKGWPMEGKSLAQAALQEAWEEAGVQGRAHEDAVGQYTYRKLLKDSIPVSCACDVFRIEVEHLADDWPEADRRERRWVPLDEAIELVDEAELKHLLTRL